MNKIKLEFRNNNQNLHIVLKYEIKYYKELGTDYFNCNIPAFDISFSSKGDIEKLKHKSNAFVKMFFMFNVEERNDFRNEDKTFSIEKFTHFLVKTHNFRIEDDEVFFISNNDSIFNNTIIESEVYIEIEIKPIKKTTLLSFWKAKDSFTRDKIIKDAFSLIDLQEEYINLLGEEINSMVSICHAHGYRSKLVDKGIEIRNKINSLEYD